jgi:hypothetical protein
MAVTCRPPARQERKLRLTTWAWYSSVRAMFQETDSTTDRLKSFARPLASQVRVAASVARIANHG